MGKVENNLKHRFVTVFLSLLLVLSGICYGQQALTRQRAKELIPLKYQPPTYPAVIIELDTIVENEFGHNNLNHWKLFWSTPSSSDHFRQIYQIRERITNVYKNLGMVSYAPISDANIRIKKSPYLSDSDQREMLLQMGKDKYPAGIAHLTPAGIVLARSENWSCKTLSNGNFLSMSCSAPLSSEATIEVTGITRQGSESLAYYNRKFTPSRVGYAMLKEFTSDIDSPALNEKIPGLKLLRNGESGEARFQLFDDGWRIVVDRPN